MTLALAPPLQPMLCRAEEEIPADGPWLYEPKWDGFRALAFLGEQTLLLSRNGQPLERYFPEVIEALRRAVPGEAVLDGEIVLATSRGLEFDLLQNRLHPAQSRVLRLASETPASFVAFDCLAVEQDDLRELPLIQRRARLLPLVCGDHQVAVTPQTTDVAVATEWFARFEGAGLDGVVAKRPDQPYQPGVRGWTKIKHRRTADMVVGGMRLTKDRTGVASLLLGLYDAEGVLHHVGHTSSFSVAESRRLRQHLASLEGGESFGRGRTPGAPSRWSRGRDASWIALSPELVCEVSFDHMQGDRLRHASRLLRWRSDKLARECTVDQLDRPEDFDLGAIIDSWRRQPG